MRKWEDVVAEQSKTIEELVEHEAEARRIIRYLMRWGPYVMTWERRIKKWLEG